MKLRVYNPLPKLLKEKKKDLRFVDNNKLRKEVGETLTKLKISKGDEAKSVQTPT